MPYDYSFQILEAILMAENYKNRDEVISAAEFAVNTACALTNLAPGWKASYKEALKKLNSLNFDEMQEIIGILNSYDDAKPNFEFDDCGEKEYNDGKKFYEQKDYVNAVKSFRKAAEKGNVKAEYNYGICLYNGYGTARDRVEAVKRFVNAAIFGISQANKMLHFITYSELNNS